MEFQRSPSNAVPSCATVSGRENALDAAKTEVEAPPTPRGNGVGADRANPLHGWLAAAIPADAHSFRVADPALASTLAFAGAELVADRPDVEIGAASDLRGDARWAVVAIEAAQPEGGSLPIRAGRRLVAALKARRRRRVAASAVAARGYDDVVTIPWDIEQVLRLPSVRDSRRTLRLVEFLPQRALVIGKARGEGGGTALDAAAHAAAVESGIPLRHGWPQARAETLVVIADTGVLRVAVGPGARGMERQRVALESLAAFVPPPVVSDRVPWVIARGRTGLAVWSFERRLAGHPAPPVLGDNLLADCLDFLVALHHVAHDSPPSRSLVEDAEVAADLSDPGIGDAIRALGARLEADLAGVTRGFAHGDFWSGNLLVADGALCGVVDWDVAAPGCLPLLDLLQLRLSQHRSRTRQYVGVAVVEYLLPWARNGGDDVLHTYARRIGLAVDPARLESLVLAFWLDYVSQELRKYGDRASRPVWMRDNITVVVESLG